MSWKVGKIQPNYPLNVSSYRVLDKSFIYVQLFTSTSSNMIFNSLFEKIFIKGEKMWKKKLIKSNSIPCAGANGMINIYELMGNFPTENRGKNCRVQMINSTETRQEKSVNWMESKKNDEPRESDKGERRGDTRKRVT